MEIIKRIKLGNNDYYIKCNCEYKKENDIVRLKLKNYKDDYFDGGDLSKLIERIERQYSESIYSKYGKDIYFLADCLYIYDNIPFIDGVGDIYFIDGLIDSTSYISKEELDRYIYDNNIKMNNNNFKLLDENTWL